MYRIHHYKTTLRYLIIAHNFDTSSPISWVSNTTSCVINFDYRISIAIDISEICCLLPSLEKYISSSISICARDIRPIVETELYYEHQVMEYVYILDLQCRARIFFR